MKSIIVYSSQTGNTKRLAETIYNNLSDEKMICTIEDSPDAKGHPNDSDLEQLTKMIQQCL
jgi:flavodoxin